MQLSVILVILKALLTLVPLVVRAVQDGRIRDGAQEEVLNALVITHSQRIERAIRARDTGTTDSMSDPRNRAARSAD